MSCRWGTATSMDAVCSLRMTLQVSAPMGRGGLTSLRAREAAVSISHGTFAMRTRTEAYLYICRGDIFVFELCYQCEFRIHQMTQSFPESVKADVYICTEDLLHVIIGLRKMVSWRE